ncbi:MAG: hypothetical protein B6D55_01575 [Candidatus Omnitrophica bacterium 4484_70.2]|nr:MAG: hypothetical protein B6D55_01575 [Candidatus Omnitrophica bacterium 4484_70.2]
MCDIKRQRDKIICSKFKSLVKQFGKAVVDYKMLEPQDRVLVGLSGGKDSLSCLHLLDYHRRHAPFKYQIFVCFIDIGFEERQINLLQEHLKFYGFKYVMKKMDILKDKTVNCFWCSWNRRKILFQTCEELGCNKLVLGHNLDDIIQTTLLNIFFHGEISTASPNLEFFGGKVSLIRPLCLIEERNLDRFSKILNFPLIDFKCLQKDNSCRNLIKKTIANISSKYPYIKKNIFYSLHRIKERYLT